MLVIVAAYDELGWQKEICVVLRRLAFLIGVIAGLRAFTAPAAVSWAARLAWIPLQNTPLAFLGFAWTPYVISLLAVGELITDQLPKTPSRKVPPQFVARILTGSLSGGAIGLAQSSLLAGIIAGAIGAVAGTLGGAAARTQLAQALGKDLPAALIEDLIAIAGAVFVITRFAH